MKRTSVLLGVFGSLLVCISALIIAGCASKPPTAFEQRFFNITTNPPTLSVHTNVFEVTQFKTNQVTVQVTNVQGVVEYQTNVAVVPVVLRQTNTVFQTNAETYVYTPGAGAQSVKEIGGTVGNLFGVGGLVTTAIGGLFSLWGFVRSKKSYATAAGLAQTIETIRSFVQQLPNGNTYDTALVQFMQQHQAETGTINQVLQLLANEVSNPDAQVASAHIREAITALGVTLPPPPAKAA